MTRTILLADDSVTIQKVIELTFMDDDYRVVAVSNGDEALAKLDGARPDMVIADVHMPGTNGYGVARKAKERWPGVPVLLLVGTFEPFDEAEARSCGADGHMKKPFDSQELQQRVEQLITGTPATASVVAPPPEPVLPLPTAFEALEEDTPRRIGFDFSLESAPAAPEVPSPVAAAAETVFAPAFSFSEPAAVAPAAIEWHAAPPIEIEEVAAPAVVPSFEPQPVAAPIAAPASTNGAHLSDDDVDRIARRVIDLLGDKPVRDVAWEVVPDLAEMVIRERLRELESQVD